MRKLLLTIPAVAVAGSLVPALPGGQRWSGTELALVRSLSLEVLPASPADPSSRVGDNPRAVGLGRATVFDTRFSGNGKFACATCHPNECQFQDDLLLGQGMGRTDWRTIRLADMAHAPFLFWDGRKGSLWSQALGPLESAVEHGGDRTL